MHIAATKTETAIFVKDCQSAKWRVKNQGLSPVGPVAPEECGQFKAKEVR